jgi:hypothetical protein
MLLHVAQLPHCRAIYFSDEIHMREYNSQILNLKDRLS